MIRRDIIFGAAAFVGGAFAVGVLVNGLLDTLSAPREAAIAASAIPTVQIARANAAVEPAAVVEPKPAVELRATDSAKPTDIKTIIVRTVPIAPERAQQALPYAGEIARKTQALPAIIYSGKSNDVTASIAPAAARPAPAKEASRTPPKAEEGPFSPAQIERVKTALRLTPEQEAHWPAVEAELHAIAKQLPKKVDSKKQTKIAIAPGSADRLRWAATPLIMSLREDQKQTVRFIARSMGLEEVAAAL
jgi:hypothetical protein